MLAVNLAHVTPVEVPMVLMAFAAGLAVGAGAVLAWARARR